MGHIAYEIPDDLHMRAKICAARAGLTLKAWLERAVATAAEAEEAADQKRRR